MEFFTMSREYAQQSEVDYFDSAIWTERVLGDGDFQIVVPATPDIIRTLAYGTLVGEVSSQVPMRIDKQTIKDGQLTVIGTSLCKQLNSRFVRFTAEHHDKSYSITGSPGYVLQYLVQQMAINGDWLNGIQNMGVANPQILKIPNLSVGGYDNTLASVTIAVPYGPLYDALKNIAQSYNLGMRIVRLGEDNIQFVNWIGIDHTSNSKNALVRFSPDFDNFGATTEVVDGTNFKTHAWAFGSGLASGGGYTAGVDTVVGSFTGWDLRAEQVFADDVTSSSGLTNVLNERAYDALASNQIVGAIDGEIVPSPQYVYGTHYNLGDIIETQGTTGIIQASRVTEYIRSHDQSGESAYPTLVAVV